MNFKDVAYLKYRGIKGDGFTFVREKTKRTTATEKRITVYLHPKAKRIIDVFGNTSSNPDDYVFPLLKLQGNVTGRKQTLLAKATPGEAQINIFV